MKWACNVCFKLLSLTGAYEEGGPGPRPPPPRGGQRGIHLKIYVSKLLKVLSHTKCMPRFSCVSCEAPDCDEEDICENAVVCYTAHVRDVDGEEMKSKGCSPTHSHV